MLNLTLYLFKLSYSVLKGFDVVLGGLELLIVLLDTGVDVDCEIFLESFDFLDVHQLRIEVLLVLGRIGGLLGNTAVCDGGSSDGFVGD
jgi:hypothetical protein